MNIAGILLIAFAVTTPQGQQTTQSQSQPTPARVDRRQLYSPSAVHLASPLYPRRDTWYEFLLKQFNPVDIDYGSCMEERRQAFLDASAPMHISNTARERDSSTGAHDTSARR